MAYLVQDLETDLEAMLHGTSLSSVSSVLPLINRAARHVVLDIDPYETKRSAQIGNALYDKVYNYISPSDLKGSKIIDIRPQVNRTSQDNFSQFYSSEFDIYKSTNDDMFQVEYLNGIKTLRISKSLTAATLLHDMSSISGNGTWTVADNATNLVVDNLQFVAESSSLSFDTTGGGAAATIVNSTMTAIDLSSMNKNGSLFMWVYMPVVVTNVILRWGSSAAAYWQQTVTSAHDTTSFVVGWNLLRFSWQTATKVGVPVDTAINYLKVTLTTDGTAQTQYRVDSITAQLGSIYNIIYYSKFLFTNETTGAFQETAINAGDGIVLDTESRNILLYKCGELACEQIGGSTSSADVKYFNELYKEAIEKYATTNKGETKKPHSTYYRLRSAFTGKLIQN